MAQPQLVSDTLMLRIKARQMADDLFRHKMSLAVSRNQCTSVQYDLDGDMPSWYTVTIYNPCIKLRERLEDLYGDVSPSKEPVLPSEDVSTDDEPLFESVEHCDSSNESSNQEEVSGKESLSSSNDSLSDDVCGDDSLPDYSGYEDGVTFYDYSSGGDTDGDIGQPIDYNSFTVKELKELLTDKGITFKSNARKADLIMLLG